MTDFLDDAEHRTDSWKRRHSPEVIAQMGVWRWKGIQSHAGTILDLICGKRVIDFGGADGPLGFGSTVVDAKAECKTLDDVPGRVDVIFTSHTLEHLDDPQAWLRQAYERLSPGGVLIVHVPAWTCERWRAGRYDNPNQPNGHTHTFCLCDDMDRQLESMVSGEFIVGDIRGAGFDIDLAEYCGDNSIIVTARKA